MSLLACWVIGIAGCGVEDARPTGTLEVPLTAPGAGGALYRLPAGTSLHVSSGDFFAEVALDGAQPSIAAEVAMGFYAYSYLTDADRRTPSSWPLIRQNPDGTVDAVDATLEPIPPFMVSDGASTQLTLQFHVAAAGAIQFAVGNLDVVLAVGEDAPAGYTFEASGTIAPYDTSISALAPAAFVDRMAQIGDGELHYTVRTDVTGWYLRSGDTACAPAELAIEIDGPSAVAEAVQESRGGDRHELCVIQAGSSTSWSLTAWRHGAPTSALFADLDAPSVFALADLHGTMAGMVLEHGVLHLERVASAGVASSGLMLQLGVAPSTAIDTWAVVAASGQGTMKLTPRL